MWKLNEEDIIIHNDIVYTVHNYAQFQFNTEYKRSVHNRYKYLLHRYMSQKMETSA